MKRLLRALGWIALLIMLMGIGFELAEKFGGSPMLGGSAATAVWICLILWMTRDRTRAAVPPLPPVQESPLQVEEKQPEEAETEPIQKPRIRVKPLVVEVPSEVPAESDQNTEPEPTRNTAKTWMLTALGLIGFVALVMSLSSFEETASTQETETLASSSPVELPEGTWRPPAYSEQQRRAQDHIATRDALDNQTTLAITHHEIPRLAPDALSRSGYPVRPKLVDEVARAMQEIRNACPGTHIEVIAGLLAGEYSRKPWAQIQTKAHASVVEMNRVVSERTQAGPLCSREVDMTGLAMLVLSDANYPHNPNRESDQVLIESVESGIQRIQEACPNFPADSIAIILSELYQEGELPSWNYYMSDGDSDLMAVNLAGLTLHLTITSAIKELRNIGCE